MELSPEKISFIKESGLQRLRNTFPWAKYGRVKSEVEGWMVDIGLS